MSFNVNGGRYSRTEVDRIEREQVTETMIDRAIICNAAGGGRRKGNRSVAAITAAHLEDRAFRARTRRNIAIGLACGSYKPENER